MSLVIEGEVGGFLGFAGVQGDLGLVDLEVEGVQNDLFGGFENLGINATIERSVTFSSTGNSSELEHGARRRVLTQRCPCRSSP